MFDDEKPKRKRVLPERPSWLKMGCVGIAVVLFVGLAACAVITVTVVNVVGSVMTAPFSEYGDEGFEREDEDDD